MKLICLGLLAISVGAFELMNWEKEPLALYN